MRHPSRVLHLLVPVACLSVAGPVAAQSANVVPVYDAQGNLVSSSLADLGGTLMLRTGATSQVQVVGAATSARFGQDALGGFVSSDTPGRSFRMATVPTGGELTAWAQLTGNGIFSFTPDAAGNGEIAIGRDDLDRVQDYDGQAGDQMHFRLSRGACDPFADTLAPGCDKANPFAQNFTIAPYDYGISMSYPGLVEMNLTALSIHNNHAACYPEYSCNRAGQLLVGDEWDAGGLYATAHLSALGSSDRGSVVIAADTWAHTSHGSIDFQVRDPGDRFSFQVGPYTAETEVASIDAGGTGHFTQGIQTGGTAIATLMSTNGTDDDGHAVTYQIGDVLEIDPTADRQVRLSDERYSHLVAGVYASGTAVLSGAAVTTAGATSLPMATSGIAPCKVSAENGPVHRGDLLVTAGHDGYAMRGTDHDKTTGAVVGKALQEMPSGQGVIDILVTLQ